VVDEKLMYDTWWYFCKTTDNNMEKYFEEEWRRKWFDIMKKLCENVPPMLVSWVWEMLSENPNATIEFIFTNISYPWNWKYVSSNINLTLDIVLANPDKLWNWKNLTKNSNITESQMDNHPNLPWEKCEMFIYEFNKRFDVYFPKTPRKIISPFIPEIPHLESLQMLREMATQPDKDWNYGRIVYDDNLPLKFVANHIKNFEEHAHSICRNEFTTDKHYYILHYIKWMHIITIFETHIENAKTIDCSNLSAIERILFDEFLVATLLKW
jgi:hypothetical protein